VDNFRIYPIDSIYARVDTVGMKTNEIQSKTYGTITREQAIAILMARTIEAPKASFSNGTPKDGWKDADRIK
jgi:hypothetical protein